MPAVAPTVPTDWQAPPADVGLVPDGVHVWRVSLAEHAKRGRELAVLLGEDERARATRMRDPRHRTRFVIARGCLRLILARYLPVPPAALRFDYGPRGKPSLATQGDRDLRFNLTHSGDVALYAVTTARRIGIDVERIRPETRYERIAARMFPLAELETLRARPAAERRAAFFHAWTRKEALIKAAGSSLWMGMGHTEAALAELPARAGALGSLVVCSLPCGSEHAAALAVEGDGWHLSSWRW
jgi:4'-phosphopantetheinyl transferase